MANKQHDEEPEDEGTTPEPSESTDALDDAALAEPLSDEDAALLDAAERDLVAEMRSDMLRAQAELVNFRTRVERDRAANRDAVIAEVMRSLLPTMDDLARAEALPGPAAGEIAQKVADGPPAGGAGVGARCERAGEEREELAGLAAELGLADAAARGGLQLLAHPLGEDLGLVVF